MIQRIFYKAVMDHVTVLCLYKEKEAKDTRNRKIVMNKGPKGQKPLLFFTWLKGWVVKPNDKEFRKVSSPSHKHTQKRIK